MSSYPDPNDRHDKVKIDWSGFKEYAQGKSKKED